MGDVASVDLKAALRAQLGSQRRKVSASAEGRRALEREANNPHDGRMSRIAVAPTQSNTAQVNVEVPEELKQRLVNAKRSSGEDLKEIVARALEVELAKMERQYA